MIEPITPKIFFDVVRGKASLDDTNRVYEALGKRDSDLNQWLHIVEQYAESIFGNKQGRSDGRSSGTSSRRSR